MGSLLDLALKHDHSQPMPQPSSSGSPALTVVQEAARREVLARLEAHPNVERAFVTRWDGEMLIVTLGLRGVGTGELAIPAERIRGKDLTVHGELLDWLTELGACS